MPCVKTIVFFGDSICVGQGVSIHRGWVPRVAGKIEALGCKLGVRYVIVNSGVNGGTTRLALERIPQDLQSYAASIVVVQFGMNDCNFWQTDRCVPRVSQEAFVANLKEIVHRGRNFGAEHIFMNTNHPTLRDDERMMFTNITYQDSNRRYNDLIREAVSHLDDDVSLIDIEAAFNRIVDNREYSLRQLLLPDNLHLSQLGHDVYVRVVGSELVAGIRKVSLANREI